MKIHLLLIPALLGALAAGCSATPPLTADQSANANQIATSGMNGGGSGDGGATTPPTPTTCCCLGENGDVIATLGKLVVPGHGNSFNKSTSVDDNTKQNLTTLPVVIDHDTLQGLLDDAAKAVATHKQNFPNDPDIPQVYYSDGGFDLSQFADSNKVIRSGVYVSNGQISLAGAGYSGKVTLVADTIHVSGKDNKLSYFQDSKVNFKFGDCLLMYTWSSHGAPMYVAGSNNCFTGLIDSPYASFHVSGSSNTFNGQSEALDMSVSGSSNCFVPFCDM